MVLAPVYYRCPMLCSQILSGVVAGLRPLSLKPGRDFDVVAISFDPADTPGRSGAEARLSILIAIRAKPASTAGIFWWAARPAITAVMQAIGFHYRWDPVHKMFIHASGVMIAHSRRTRRTLPVRGGI